jgi:hypothetical protein
MPIDNINNRNIDLSEDEILSWGQGILQTLLIDRTTGHNIYWATDDYESKGEGYTFFDEITIEKITGKNARTIQPRILKTSKNQRNRSRTMAEVFTPSWICNAQNNLVDEAWFGRKDVFNVEDTTTHTWQTNPNKIEFPEGKTWKDYVRATRMEITCGEAPYLVSRYDATTGEPIPIQQRIGLLDRKLRVVSENTETSGDWLEWAQVAYKHTYGYEWQGDNLLLAREALLWTFIEYYQEKFGKRPLLKSSNYMAYIISWNLWQMDGLRCVVPDSCKDGVMEKIQTLFGEEETKVVCQGCHDENIHKHNGIYCLIREWGVKDLRTREDNRKIRFVDLIPRTDGK